MLDRLVDRVDDLDREHEREELRVPVLVLGAQQRARELLAGRGAAAAVDAQLDAVGLQRAQRARAGTRPAASTWTSSVSAALHTPGRWVLALTMIRSAASRSALGVDVDVAVARRRVDHRHRRDALERVLQPLAAARDDEVDDAVLGRELRELLAAAAGDEGDRALGQAGGSAASAAMAASTAFECAADDEPRSTIALPDFRHSAAASIVTFGRAS